LSGHRRDDAELWRQLLASQTGPNRREMLKLLCASAALAGASGCSARPDERILPYVEQPPEVTPGIPLRYATSMVLDGFATGLIVESRVGRPTKIEGNPQHPASLGATGVYEQASILGLYDPTRARSLLRDDRPASWRSAYEELSAARAPWFLMHPQSSPLLADLMERVRARHPNARFSFHSPLERREVYQATSSVFGEPLEMQLDFTRAARILALDADFTAGMPMSVRWAHDFARARRLAAPRGDMNRLYAVETMVSPTGSLADHRLLVPSAEVA